MRTWRLVVCAGGLVALGAILAFAMYVARLPCSTTTCADWGTTSTADRIPGRTTGGLAYGLMGAFFWAPVYAPLAFAVGALPVWYLRRSRVERSALPETAQ